MLTVLLEKNGYYLRYYLSVHGQGQYTAANETSQ